MEKHRRLDVTIGPPDGTGVAVVEAVLQPGGDRAHGWFRPPLARPELRHAATLVDRGDLRDPVARDTGRRLYRALVKGSVRGLVEQAMDNGPLPLSLHLDDAVWPLPWELLFDPDHEIFWCAEGGVARSVAVVSFGSADKDGSPRVARTDAVSATAFDPAGSDVVVVSHGVGDDVETVDLAHRVAPLLLAKGAGAVVVAAIPDDEAAPTVVDTLATSARAGDAVDVAVAAAVRARRATRVQGGLPVLVRAHPDAGPTGAVDGRALRHRVATTWRGTWRRTLAVAGVAATLLGLTATLLGLWDRALPRFQGPEPMSGRFNIAVAQFDAPAGGSADRAQSAAFAREAANVLETELRASADGVQGVQVRHPDATGLIRGRTVRERAASAAALARRINADLVLYGSFVVREGFTNLRVELHVSERKFPGAEELAGAHVVRAPVGRIGDVSRNVVAMDRMQRDVARKARALATFVVGLGHYAYAEYEDARALFTDAIRSEHWGDAEGAEVLYLSLANANSKLGDHGRAREAYEAALEIVPEYGRARFGLAEVMFIQAAGDCGPRADAAGLDEAARRLELARRAAIQPPLAAVEHRVAVGLARVDVCRSRAGFTDRWDEADQALRSVVAAYERAPRPGLDELAAEAYALRGLIAYRPGQAARSDRAIARGGELYRTAAELSPRPDRASLYWGLVGRINTELGDRDAAVRAYRVALDDAPTQRRGHYRCMVRQLGSIRGQTPERAGMIDALARCDGEVQGVPPP